ncbi:hypothetical protein [Pacificoceanicola onchidii]|uniref:hypothetical protein n=1 Tax=Pacificoceanicola onchidii TaxID=2562685 RepID=UPI0010A2E646|nr:hypothetical protein [Pacificoceanicola onchidii]
MHHDPLNLAQTGFRTAAMAAATAAAVPIKPLTAREAVPDDALRLFAKGEPCWSQGVISEQFSAMLVMSLPDICGELLAWRAAGRRDPQPFPNPRNHAEEIANARAEAAAEVDADPIERIEGLAQHASDELADTNLHLVNLTDASMRIEAMLSQVLTELTFRQEGKTDGEVA